MSPYKPPCPVCGTIHGGTDTRIVGRFKPSGPVGYRANYTGAPWRPTRAQAERDMCAHRAARADS